MTFKADTIEQFRILQFIQQNFDTNCIKIEIVSSNTMRVTDQKNDSIIFMWSKKHNKVIWLDKEMEK